jgi:hypothetical protein
MQIASGRVCTLLMVQVQNTINFFKANKGVWWMPRVYEAMKDVVSCDKPGGAAHKRYIPGFPNGTTWYAEGISLLQERANAGN